jgi:hypothetical protein
MKVSVKILWRRLSMENIIERQINELQRLLEAYRADLIKEK